LISIRELKRVSAVYRVPIEDVFFIALNMHGVNFPCDYNRMRSSFRLADSDLFAYARERGDRDYYLALPVNPSSPFSVVNRGMLLDGVSVGDMIDPTEDICDSNYPRRRGTSLNLNPHSRTSCRGCEFCYTAYQVPLDLKMLVSESDLHEFFDGWLKANGLDNLSHLIQVSVVTGCYRTSEELCAFLLRLRDVLGSYQFNGRIFYLGSQVTTTEQLDMLRSIQPFGICYSLEVFERRELLKTKKRALSIEVAHELMAYAAEVGHEVNFAYIVGLESLDVIERYFRNLASCINKFPTINVLQLHKNHSLALRDPSATSIEYYLQARSVIEGMLENTSMRPLVWEDYRSLWYLTYDGRPLEGIRTP
jgi:hypothetical protein